MDKQLIKSIITENQQRISKVKLQQRGEVFDEKSNYVLIGIRRAGKSYTLYQDIQSKIEAHKALPEDILYVNFEDERIASIRAEELGILLECYMEMHEKPHPYIYLDEIQNITGWEKFARRIAEEKHKVMITGSNAKMLSREIASSLGGSYIQRIIYPFSFNEYLEYHGIQLSKNWEYNPEIRRSVIRHFEDYFFHGGFAETFDKNDQREWLTSLYQKILMGDIMERNRIRNPRIFRLLARKLADSVMQPTTLRRLENIIKSTGDSISPQVLKDYLDYMDDAFLTFAIPNLISPLNEQQTIAKHYFADNGILNLFLMHGDTKLLENLVAIHLSKRYRNTTDDVRLFYYNKGIEIDFCIPETKTAIQVSYSINDPTTYEREIGGLVKFIKAFKQYHGIIITRDTERQIIESGITIDVIPIWKWLLK